MLRYYKGLFGTSSPQGRRSIRRPYLFTPTSGEEMKDRGRSGPFYRLALSAASRKIRAKVPIIFRPRLLFYLALACLVFFGCRPSQKGIERVFSALPKRNYDSIECSNLLVARELMGISAVDHRSPTDEKLAYFSRMNPFTFSMEEYSFLVADRVPLGFDPSDFFVSVVARTAAHSVTVVWGNFDADTIAGSLIGSGYRESAYRGHTLYCLPWSDAPLGGGLPLTFSNLTFLDDDLIAYAPTERLLKDYLDWIEVGSLAEDEAVMELVDRLSDQSSFYLSRGVKKDDLYGDDSLFIRRPEDWGLIDYRLSPYIYFAFGIRPAEDKKRQVVTLLILYPDGASAQRDQRLLLDGLKRGKSLSRLVPFSELFSVQESAVDDRILKTVLESNEGADIRLLIRLRDLPFLVY